MKHIATLSVCVLLASCAHHNMGPTASVQLEPTRGNAAKGELHFMQRGNGVKVMGKISGLKPNAEHGFHIHDKGDCSSGDGMSAAGHFNPTGKAHGAHGQGEHHAGDIPSLMADANGVANVNFESNTISLMGGQSTNIIGRGVIVHKDPDDYKTQPTGNSGARLACGVIKQ